jgi:DnaK suppressor protein
VRALVSLEKLKMSKTKFNDVRRVLEAKRSELLNGISDRNEIRIENAAEEFDRLQQQLNREVAIRNLDRESRLLKDVQAALGRLEEGTFGVCLRCEEEIPEKRLKALPWAAYCVPCQQIMDRLRATGDLIEDKGEQFELAA